MGVVSVVLDAADERWKVTLGLSNGEVIGDIDEHRFGGSGDESLIGEGSDEEDLDQVEDHRWQPPHVAQIRENPGQASSVIWKQGRYREVAVRAADSV